MEEVKYIKEQRLINRGGGLKSKGIFVCHHWLMYQRKDN